MIDYSHEGKERLSGFKKCPSGEQIKENCNMLYGMFVCFESSEFSIRPEQSHN